MDKRQNVVNEPAPPLTPARTTLCRPLYALPLEPPSESDELIESELPDPSPNPLPSSQTKATDREPISRRFAGGSPAPLLPPLPEEWDALVRPPTSRAVNGRP